MKNKKAFTVVELVIVIAIIAILAAVLIPTFAAIIKKANVSKDQQLIKNLNTALATDRASNNNQNHMTMTDALKAAEDFGYDVSKINASATDNTILWDQFNDVFCYYDKDKNDVDYIPEVNVAVGDRLHAGDYGLWKIYNAKSEPVPAYGDQTYSIYLGEGAVMFAPESNGQYKFQVGVDVGKNTDVLNILYDFNAGSATNKHSVIIRTDNLNAELEENAPYDDVKHFGIADTVTLTSISATSYYEYGHVMVVIIKTGRLIITNYPGAKVEGIFLSATGNGYDNIYLAIQDGAKLPTLIRREALTTDPDPADETAKILVATVQKVNADGSVIAGTEEKIYLYGSHTAKEQDKGYVGVSELGTLILEALSGSTEPGVTDAIKVPKIGTLADVKSAAISNSFETESTNVFLINDKFDLLKLAYMVNNGEDTTGKTYKLTADIDLGGMDWTPIGYLSADDTTNGKAGIVSNHTLNIEHSKAFQGTFDGNNRTISNLKISHPYGDGKLGIGLFGLVVGSAPNPQYHGSDKAHTYVYSNGVLDETKFNNSNYSAVIKDLTVDVTNITTGDTEYHTGTICGIAYNACIDNCDVSNLTMSVACYAGGVAGSIGDSVIKASDVTSGTIDAGAHEAGGVVGVLEAWFNESTSHSMVLNCSNRASVKGQTQIGGIVGYAQSSRSGIIAKCTNYGDVSLVETDYIHHTAGGICGWGTSVCLYFQCTNNGSVTGFSHTIDEASADNNGVHVGGITVNQANSQIISCVNNGELSGYANYMGGIVSATVTEPTVTILNCGSNGEFNNSYTSGFTGKYYGKAGVTTNVTITGTVDSLDMVQDYVNSLGTASINLTDFNVTNKEGVLIIPSSCTTLTVNTNVCEKISLAGGRSSLIKIYAPGVDVVLNQDDTKGIMLYEAKNVSIEPGTTLNVLNIGNVEKTYNSGTITEVLFFVRNESSDAPLTTYFENNGSIGPSSTNSVIRFVAPNAAANHRGCLHARIYIVNNGVITANNDNAIAISSDGVNDTIVNIHFNSGCELNSIKRMATVSGSTNYLNISYHSSFKDTHGTEAPSVKPGPSARTISGSSANYTITENDTPNYKFDFD